MKLTIVLQRRSTIYVYLNPANDSFLCSVSFLLPCAPSMPNKSADIYKDFFFFFSPFFFFISPITSFFSLSLLFAIPHRRKQITEKMRERETQRRRVCQHITSHHIILHTYKNLILRSLSFSNAGVA